MAKPPEEEVNAAEAKTQRKAAKREAAAAAAAEEEAAEAKRQRKAAKRVAAEVPEEDAAEAKRQRTLAKIKQMAAEAAAAGSEEDEEPAKKETASGSKGKAKGRGNKEFEVFVGSLPSFATDDDVKIHFLSCGSIKGFNMPRNNDGHHRGKAFLEFDSRAACDKALRLHESYFSGSSLEVYMAADASAKASRGQPKQAKGAEVDTWKKALEVVVGGLPFAMTEEAVREHFGECGKIVALRMPPHLRQKGVAFIAFSTKDACAKALELHGTKLAGRPLYIHQSAGDAKKTPGQAPAAGKNSGGKGDSNVGATKEFEVFVGGLPFTTTENVLRQDFSDCGELVALRMVLNSEGTCKGSAFLEYGNAEAFQKALAFDGTDYGGRVIRVRWSGDSSGKGDKDKGKGKGKDGGKGKGAKVKANKDLECMISGLPFSATSDSVRTEFSECGEIVRLVLPLNEEGQAKGNAYIEFIDKKACDKALAFHDTQYGGRWIRVRMSNDREGTAGGGAEAGKKKEEPAEKPNRWTLMKAAASKVVTFDSDDE